MIIVFILIALLIYRLNLIIRNKKEKNSISQLIIIVGIVCLVSLFILQIELNIHGFIDGTGGSDATVYYKRSIQILEEGTFIEKILSGLHAAGYHVWGALIQYLSFYRSVVWIKICNILIFLHLLLSLYFLLRKINYSHQISLFSVSILSLDGIFIWTATRNLRDIIIMYLIIEAMLIIETIFSKRMTDIRLWVGLSILIITLGLLRLFSLFFVFMTLLIYVYKIFKFSIPKVIGLSLIILITLVIFNTYFGFENLMYYHEYLQYTSNKEVQRQSLAKEYQEGSPLKRVIIGSARYILLPNPMTNISYLVDPEMDPYRHNTFDGVIGNIWKAESAFIWWMMMPLSILAIFNRKYWNNRLFLSLIAIFFVYMFVYGYVFGGATSFRNKIPIHLTGILFAITNLSEINPKKVMLYYPIIGIPLILIGYFMSLSVR